MHVYTLCLERRTPFMGRIVFS